LKNFNPVPNPDNNKALRQKRIKEMAVIAGSLTVIAALSSILFKRI
jgi:hypothetical protein